MSKKYCLNGNRSARFLDKADEIISGFYKHDNVSGMPDVEKDFINTISPSVSLILDFSSREYLYVSENVYDLLGIQNRELIAGGYPRFLKLFKENQREIFIDHMLPLFLKWYQQLIADKKCVVYSRLSYNLCMTDVSGRIIPTVHILKPISVNSSGLPRLIAKYIIDISFMKEKVEPQLKMEYRNSKNEFELCHHRTFCDLDESALSAREQEILDLIRKGFTTRKIADKLFISIHTINNHRKNIVKKCNVKSIFQLI
jgi:DNA-binding CsgD family transcriptional regulator